MDIRLAQPQDVPGILALLRQIGDVHHKGRPDLFRANAQKYSASQILAILDSVTNPIYVAVAGQKVLGCGFCKIRTHFHDPVIADHTTLYIDDICVDADYRRRHIATALYQKMLGYAQLHSCHNVTLNVWSCNPIGIKFCESLGFKPQNVGMEAPLEES